VNFLFIALFLGLSTEPQLRSPLTQSEAVARDTLAIAEQLDLEAQIHKSYQHGLGWQYSVSIRGFSTSEEASAAAVLLAEKTGRGVDLLLDDSDSRLGWLTPLPVLPSAENLRMRVVRALGGVDGGRHRLEKAKSLSFVYSRRLPKQDLVANHRFDRFDDFYRAEIAQPATPSRDVVFLHGPQGDWVKQGGVFRPVAANHFALLQEKLRPSAVYGGILAMPALLASDLDYGRLRVAGQELIDFRNAIRLEGESPHGKVILWVEASTALPISWQLDTVAGSNQWVFSDWRAIESNLILPVLMEVYGDGKFLDQIRLEEIGLFPVFSVDSFSVPELP
jgi:hypothetical protein